MVYHWTLGHVTREQKTKLINSNRYVGLGGSGLGGGVKTDPPDTNFQSPVWGSSSTGTQFQFPIDRSATEQATPTTLNYDCPETACICTAASSSSAAAGALCNVTASLALSVNSTRHYHHCICPSSRPASFALCSRACVAAGANRECF